MSTARAPQSTTTAIWAICVFLKEGLLCQRNMMTEQVSQGRRVEHDIHASLGLTATARLISTFATYVAFRVGAALAVG